MKILVVIPAYNEETRIGEVVEQVRANCCQGCDILVVDDGSLDRTALVAGTAGAKVISHPFNLGYGVTIQTGYKYAQAKNYDYVVQIDGDGQHDPTYIPRLLEPVLSGESDFVLGSRFLNTQSYEPSLARKLGMGMFRQLISRLIKSPITDSTSGYQAFSRRVVNFFCTEVFPCDYPDADMLLTLHRAGFSIKEVPVRMYASVTGKSMHTGLTPLYYLFKMFLSIFVTLLRKKEVPR